ncbi:MAG: discoidin domain-containing protein, partial [Bacteroidales bacterium]
HFNWLGFEGEDLEAIIDLGKETVIREISVDFLQDVQSWVFLPKQFTASYSTDGEQFTEIGTVENITPDNKTGAFIKTFTIPAENIKARYIKVKAESLKICPGWHIGSGKKSWIFTDEIVVK